MEAESEETRSDVDSEEMAQREMDAMYVDHDSLVYAKESRRPERLTARQRAMVYGDGEGEGSDKMSAGKGNRFDFKGGIDEVGAVS